MMAMTQGLVGLPPRRKAAGYTQETLADALEIKRSRFAAWESGVWPSARWLPVLASLLDCSIQDLYEDNTVKPPGP